MSRKKNFFESLTHWFSDEHFLLLLEEIQVAIAKTLSLAMVVVIVVCCGQLIVYLTQKLLTDSTLIFKVSLFEIFGLFLNVLIALEILENISSYLKKHVIQVELVIITSLIAVGRKIIIFDLDKKGGQDLIGLALAVLALSISYLIVRLNKGEDKH
ncbi:MAG: phosphate-starvation-inducible PsiE family protein [Planktothrix sp.]|uniref:phosphate-starvation-inducible PsiE family protein n=1 Tax=Planktothrix sp. TaxID=3088171 RepID=UPI0038D49E37